MYNIKKRRQIKSQNFMQTEPLTQKHKLWVNALRDLKDSLGNLSLGLLGRGVWVCVCVCGVCV